MLTCHPGAQSAYTAGMSGTVSTIYTIGHSTRSGAQLVALLRESAIERLVDIRRFPASRRWPQFGKAALQASLNAAGIDYAWLGDALGGRRNRLFPKDDTRNALWQNASFRYYADYALTADFAAGLAALEKLADEKRCAIMCSEAVWWRCHRRIVTDHLIARGHPVRHIMAPGHVTEASLTPGAVPAGGSVTYPPAPLTHTDDLFGRPSPANNT